MSSDAGLRAGGSFLAALTVFTVILTVAGVMIEAGRDVHFLGPYLFWFPVVVGVMPFTLLSYFDLRDAIDPVSTRTLRLDKATWQLNTVGLWSSCTDRGTVRRLENCISSSHDCTLIEQIPNGGRLKHQLNLDLDTKEAAWLANLITAWLLTSNSGGGKTIDTTTVGGNPSSLFDSITHRLLS